MLDEKWDSQLCLRYRRVWAPILAKSGVLYNQIRDARFEIRAPLKP